MIEESSENGEKIYINTIIMNNLIFSQNIKQILILKGANMKII